MVTATFLFAILCGFFLAVMDRTAEPVAYRNSVFRKLNPKWWLRSVSWEYVGFIRGTRYRPDAWHIAKSCMILCCALMAPWAYKIQEILPSLPFWMQIVWKFSALPSLSVLSLLVTAGILATTITGSFVIFYDYVLKVKTDGKSAAADRRVGKKPGDNFRPSGGDAGKS